MKWCWIIPVAVGLITALLGYFMGRWSKQKIVDQWIEKSNATQTDLNSANNKINRLEEKLKASEKKEEELNQDLIKLRDRFALLQREWDNNRTEIQNLREENESMAVNVDLLEKEVVQLKDKSDPKS